MLSSQEARALALSAQGMSGTRPKSFQQALDTLGVVQLDSVNVCVRTHYMPFYSRLGPYDRAKLDTFLNQRNKHCEYWAHEAALMPVSDFPLWRWKMAKGMRWKRAREVSKRYPGLLDDVLAQIAERGPMTTSCIEAPKEKRGAWWGHGPGKIALEWLFYHGQVSALRDARFRRQYDLVERMIPGEHLQKEISESEAKKTLLLRSIDKLGIASAKDAADYYRLPIVECRQILKSLLREGRILEESVESWSCPAYLPAETRSKKRRGTPRSALLSPFDPLVWNRDRVERLFGFHYRIEIYVPQDKRKFGYYVLPFLQTGEMTARVDLKLCREEGRLEVRAAHVEKGRDPAAVAKALAAELDRFAGWLGAVPQCVGRKGNLLSQLRKAL